MRRRLVAAVLVCAFIALAAYYYANITYHVEVPREREVSADYDAYVGRNVTISGEVLSTSADSFVLQGAQDIYTVFSTMAVTPGDYVTVVGELEPGHQIRVTSEATSSWELVLSALVYVRSFIALIFVAALFFASWRVDWRGRLIRPKKPDAGLKGGA